MYAVYTGVYCAPQAGVLIANSNRMASQLLRNVHHGSSRRHERREARRIFNFGMNGWEGGRMAERTGERAQRGDVIFCTRLRTIVMIWI